LRFVESEPGVVGRVLVDAPVREGALAAVVAEAIEVQRVLADVVERGIGQDADAALGGFRAQSFEGGFVAEGRVDLPVVGCVVLVVA